MTYLESATLGRTIIRKFSSPTLTAFGIPEKEQASYFKGSKLREESIGELVNDIDGSSVGKSFRSPISEDRFPVSSDCIKLFEEASRMVIEDYTSVRKIMKKEELLELTLRMLQEEQHLTPKALNKLFQVIIKLDEEANVIFDMVERYVKVQESRERERLNLLAKMDYEYEYIDDIDFLEKKHAVVLENIEKYLESSKPTIIEDGLIILTNAILFDDAFDDSQVINSGMKLIKPVIKQLILCTSSKANDMLVKRLIREHSYVPGLLKTAGTISISLYSKSIEFAYENGLEATSSKEILRKAMDVMSMFNEDDIKLLAEAENLEELSNAIFKAMAAYFRKDSSLFYDTIDLLKTLVNSSQSISLSFTQDASRLEWIFDMLNNGRSVDKIISLLDVTTYLLVNDDFAQYLILSNKLWKHILIFYMKHENPDIAKFSFYLVAHLLVIYEENQDTDNEIKKRIAVFSREILSENALQFIVENDSFLYNDDIMVSVFKALVEMSKYVDVFNLNQQYVDKLTNAFQLLKSNGFICYYFYQLFKSTTFEKANRLLEENESLIDDQISKLGYIK